MNDLFLRFCEIKIINRSTGETVKVSYPDPGHTIEFETEFTATRESGTVKIYNPTAEIIENSKIVKNRIPQIIISSGYENNFSQTFIGQVMEYKFTRGTDSVLELKVSDLQSLFHNIFIQKSFKDKIKASDVIRDIYSGIGQNVEIDITNDVVFERGITFNSSLQDVNNKLARATKSKFLFARSRPTFIARENPVHEVINLNYNTGLVSVEPNTKIKQSKSAKKQNEILDRYIFKTLFISQLGPSAKIQYKGKHFIAKKGKKFFSTFAESYIEVEAERL